MKIYQKWWFWLIVIIGVLIFIGMLEGIKVAIAKYDTANNTNTNTDTNFNDKLAADLQAGGIL